MYPVHKSLIFLHMCTILLESVKEIEEYTCSEDEVEVKPSSPKKSSENDPPIQSKQHERTPTKIAKKKTPPKSTGNKQGSILSFFSKK